MFLEIDDFTAIGNSNWKHWSILHINSDLSNFFYDFHSFNYLSENDMFAIKMWGRLECYEELRLVGITTSVGH